MIFAIIFALYAIVTVIGLLAEVTFAFAPVINSGTGVIVIAFIAGLITYRRIRARQGA